MSFRDDFNTLNTDVWEVYQSDTTHSVVEVVNGKLELKSKLLTEGSIRVRVMLKETVNLYNTQIEIPLEFIDSSSLLSMHFGLAVTNVPFTWDVHTSPYQRGFCIGLLGRGYDSIDGLQVWEIRSGTTYSPMDTMPKAHPTLLRVRIGKKAVYFYEVIDGEERLITNIIANIDFSDCYLQIFLNAETIYSSVSSGARIDYISLVPYNVPESQPNITLGETVTPPELPLEVVYPLLGNMIPIFVANAMLSLGERFKK